MCGINGYTGFTAGNDAERVIGVMNTSLKHRGPDALSLYADEQMALGHARLSIIDLSEAANQPMTDASGRYTIVFNGEIYNYNELRQQLVNQTLRTKSDTEVLLYLYIQQGASCLNLLRGMFALAIWDKQEKRLFIARDRIGKKPLYYYHNGKTFLFSSEIRSLLATQLVPRKLNKKALAEFITYQTVHTPQTIVKDVYMLEPGHYAVFSGDNVVTQTWWKIPEENTAGITSGEAATRVKELFYGSVKDRLVADVEVGAFLSGGIDSSAVAGVMSQVAQKSISTFTVSFDETEYSEARYAEMVAKKFNTRHHEIVLKPEEMLHELPNALAAMDHPGGDGPNTYIVSKATRAKGIKVVMTGLGGDELFAGYPVFKNALSLQKKKLIVNAPGFVKKGAAALLSVKGKSVSNTKTREILNARGPVWPNFYSVSRGMFSASFVKELLHEVPDHDPVKRYASHVYQWRFTNQSLISYISHCELYTYLQNVLLRDTDQMTMAHALEARAPFLDHRLVEYVLSLPDNVKVPVTPKALFTQAIGDLLPREIIDRPKMGFTFPWEHWMRNELKDFCEERINKLCQRNLLNAEMLRVLWDKFLEADASVNWARVWIFVVLEDWMERNGIVG